MNAPNLGCARIGLAAAPDRVHVGRDRHQLGAKDKGRVFGVAVDAAGAYYVGVRRADYDPATNGVLKLDRDWRTVAAIGFGTPGDPVFNAVHDLAVARDGTIYVAETRTKRVVKLRPAK
jgi:DNA-binding beta-propeller fold protein YncE